MIDLPNNYHYKTSDGRAVMLLPKTRTFGEKKVYIGVVEGDQGYHHWTQDGVVFGENDKKLNLKAAV